MNIHLMELEQTHGSDPSYVLHTDGYVHRVSGMEPYCGCGGVRCSHLVAHNYAYYNQAPTLEQARKIAKMSWQRSRQRL